MFLESTFVQAALNIWNVQNEHNKGQANSKKSPSGEFNIDIGWVQSQPEQHYYCQISTQFYGSSVKCQDHYIDLHSQSQTKVYVCTDEKDELSIWL